MREDMFEELLASVKEMKDVQAGRRRPGRVTRVDHLLKLTPDVAALRAQFKLSQARFAALLGINKDTLQNWEQGRRAPQGPAKVLLRVAAAFPDTLLAVNSGGTPKGPTAVKRRSAR